jgi:hypothetical protein
MRAYTIALAIFAFGFITGGLNGLGIFDVALPTSGATLTEAQVTEITEGATSGGASALQPISSLFTLGGILWEGLKTALTIIPLLTSYGVHPAVAMLIQGPIWFVYVAGVVQFFTGRNLKTGE